MSALTEPDLPVATVLPDLLDALMGRHAVLVAEPGAGKTTLVPPALLGARWLKGRVILLEPRRVVARAAARRLAEGFGEPVGRTVGMRMRMETKVSTATRIEVVTEGVFARQVLDDPELSGVGAVVFDEFHERSLDADLGLALALDVARSLRPDLRLLVMSATIDADRVAALMDGAAVVRSPGRTYPVERVYRPLNPRESVERVAASEALAAIRHGSSALVFMPGRVEVDRTIEAIAALSEMSALPLHGGLDARAQDRAVRPGTGEGPRIIVATPIAESSLTIPDVSVVVDSGLVREPVHDLGAGITRLETRRASLASVEQRAGRAGRTGPGRAIRLWPEGATRGLPAHAPPEILRTDLAGLVLDCADWGVAPETLSWLDEPSEAALGAARRLLSSLGALEGGALTSTGRAMRQLPLPPREARALLAAGPNARGLVARLAVLTTERGLGGNEADLLARERRWRKERTPRAEAAARMAKAWSDEATRLANGHGADAAAAFLMAYPDRVARARGPARPDGRRAYLLATGRGAFLEATDPLANQDWLVALDLTGAAREQRIVSAIATSRSDVAETLASTIVSSAEVAVDPKGSLQASRTTRLGAIELERARIPLGNLKDENAVAALLDHLRARGLSALDWSGAPCGLRERLAWLHARQPETYPDVSDDALLEGLETWLAPFLTGLRSLAELRGDRLRDALTSLLDWEAQSRLGELAPTHFNAPTGTRARLDYPLDGTAPRLAIRVQELFGLAEHPSVAGEPLVLDLLSPARRPIQTTTDLPGFWAGSWAEVRRDMRARYPRHPWPEDPVSAEPTTRAKPRAS